MMSRARAENHETFTTVCTASLYKVVHREIGKVTR